MKKFILVAVFAIFCLGSNALARGVSEPILRIGVHVGIGTTGYWDYPSESLVGSDDWGGVAADLLYARRNAYNFEDGFTAPYSCLAVGIRLL